MRPSPHRSQLARLMEMVCDGRVNPNEADRWLSGRSYPDEVESFREENLPASLAEAEHEARAQRSEDDTQRVDLPKT